MEGDIRVLDPEKVMNKLYEHGFESSYGINKTGLPVTGRDIYKEKEKVGILFDKPKWAAIRPFGAKAHREIHDYIRKVLSDEGLIADSI